MNPRVLLLIGAMLASPAWAQEPSFDLKGDAINKIVRDIAATQSVPVRYTEAKPVARKIVLETEDVRPLEAPIKSAPRREVAAPKPQGPISALVETFVDSALGIDDSPYEGVVCEDGDAANNAQGQRQCRRVYNGTLGGTFVRPGTQP